MGEKSISERVRSFVEERRPDPAQVRNHLAVTGPPAALQALLGTARVADDTGPGVRLGDGEWPVGYEAERVRSAHGSWTTIAEGGEPETHERHEEEAQAIFAFASSEPLDDAVARASEQHPDLVFRYASFRHRRHRDDVARGAVFQGGRRVAEHVHTVGDEPQDATDRELREWHVAQLARIAEETDRLEIGDS